MDVPLPSDLPPGALISIIYRSRNRILGEWASQAGIPVAVMSPLIYLAKHPGATQDEISRRMMIDKAAVARAIRQLEDGGYLTRIPDEANRRRYCISLTEAGIRLAEDAIAASDELDRTITTDVPQEAVPYLLPLLRSMAYTSSIVAKNRDIPGNDTDNTDTFN
ncbi:MarR family winged helix-turn-helix transcriptional regulator [Methanogenium organophilum]|uniref:MarR family transcriptional regulator n=1 Tax=Methanogenium organophilum TaxID=2199 RepID=A0A9X9S640_METOG|nr:MarR family transcriptional regulator [Methanogenium organophilum]WAI02402.1 MarR family transcriptional regulator [Methanogenium organophilum]